MRISDEGLRFIQRWESCRLRAYLDIAGVPTIGWGTTVYPTGERVRLGDEVSQEQADLYLRLECDEKARQVSALIDDNRERELTQRQVDALLSLVYNIGVTAFRRSTLRRLINEGKLGDEVERWWKAWSKAHVDGRLRVVKGLADRRAAEHAMFTRTELGPTRGV